MKQPMTEGLRFAAKLLLISLLLVNYSCETETEVPVSDPLSEHVKFLVESTGYPKESIVFDNKTNQFIIDNDLLISKVAVEDYMAGKHLQRDKNGRTEQRRYTYLVSDTYVYNIKYFLEASTPNEWRASITQAIAEWNAVGNTKVRLSETTN